MTRAALSSDLFTRPLADLDDIQARIGSAVTSIADRTDGKAVPADLALVLECARETLSIIGDIHGARARAKAFRLEHGVETLKDLWFAIADHGPLLGLHVVASADAAA